MNPTDPLPEAVLTDAIFKVLRSSENLQSYGNIQFAAMPLYVAQNLVLDQQIDSRGAPANEDLLNKIDKARINEILWDLLTQNVLAPGAGDGGYDFPFFHLTEYGKRCINEQSITPHDYNNYIKAVRDIFLGNTDDIFMMYLEESAQAFHKGLYISTTVNLGVSAERLVSLLIKEFSTTLKAPEEVKFSEALNKARHPAAQFAEVFKRLELKKQDMPEGLRNSLDMLKFIQEIIRIERNDAGHPSGRHFTKDEAMTYLTTFPSYLKIYQEVIKWLRKA